MAASAGTFRHDHERRAPPHSAPRLGSPVPCRSICKEREPESRSSVYSKKIPFVGEAMSELRARTPQPDAVRQDVVHRRWTRRRPADPTACRPAAPPAAGTGHPVRLECGLRAHQGVKFEKACGPELDKARVLNSGSGEAPVQPNPEKPPPLAGLRRQAARSAIFVLSATSEDFQCGGHIKIDQLNMEELGHNKAMYEKLVAGVAESASALALQEPDVSSSWVLLDYTSSEESTTDSDDDSPQSASSLGSKILFWRPLKWYQVYFIRIDRSGYFCMYPDLGGPFQRIDQAGSAINHHLAKLERPSMHGNSTCSVSLVYMFQRFLEKNNYSIVDRLIHEHNYYPDGTPKRGPNSRRRTNPNEEQHHLVQALLDQYNDDNSLFGNRAHVLESLLRHEWIHEKNKWYYHFNFTTKTGNLLFAEVSQRQGERAWKLEAEAARLRVVFKGLDDPDAMKRLYLRAMQQQ
ncbi:hypothetical protein C2845_PM09G01730 [Panicum miliaceum]|uniref:DUF3615 domain-containing protein n=1 Tax=Panicum miliaceum TaxID=4540 RepID=A0A3L6S0I6_PANMI|nr:hypothetical protein C2845_PM09G01730 [Panicum miliaceum]